MSAKHIKQQGAILIIMLVILIIGFTAILVNSLSITKVKNSRQANTAAALAQAKDALIGFAVTYGDTHTTPPQVVGYLPCPDSNGSNGEGSSPLGACGSKDVSQIGRLPWRTLGLNTLRDGDGECLWYAVSGTYKDNPKTGMMNWDTSGQLQAYGTDGTLLDNQVVAVIIAPGAAQSGQDRSGSGAPVCGGNYMAANYLDNDTVHTINNSDVATGKFIQSHEHRDVNGNVTLTVNDQYVYITRADIWNVVQKRTDFQPTNPNNPLKLLTMQVAICISGFGHYNPGWGSGGGWSAGNSNKSLPWPAPLVLSDYSNNALYIDTANLYAGRVPYNVGTSKSVTLNSLGSNLMTSTGSCNAISSSGLSSWLSSSLDPWWNNWKDHLFYALSSEYRPRYTHNQNCGPCLEVNNYGHQYTAVVMLAGPRLSSLNQTRTNKSVVTDYLETPNGTNFSGATGNEGYQTGTPSSTFNDTLCYINESLGVTCP